MENVATIVLSTEATDTKTTDTNLVVCKDMSDTDKIALINHIIKVLSPEELDKCTTDEEYTVRAFDKYAIHDCATDGFILPLKNFNPDRLLFNPVVCDDKFCWEGSNAVEIALLICKSEYSTKSMKKFLKTWFDSAPYVNTLYRLTLPTAVAPYRAKESDSGFDLTLVRHLKDENEVSFFTTGVILVPPPRVWYLLVPRSSMAKVGYAMANSVGIIDSSYRGEVIIALRKVRPDAPPVELPVRWVQVIPQQYIRSNMVETSSITKTARGNTGGLGSHQFCV